MKPFARLGLESIDFQNDDFGIKLETTLLSIKDYLDKKPDASRQDVSTERFDLALSNHVKTRLGLNVEFVFDTDCVGAVMVFPVNKNHVLLPEAMRDNYFERDQAKLTKEFNNKVGMIDLANARVTGIFTEYKHRLYIDILGLLKGSHSQPLTASEVTAIILHELGHVFTYYELSDRLNSTNQVLAELALSIKKPKDKAKRIYLFKELSEKLNVPSSTFDDILEEDSTLIFGTKLFKHYSMAVSTLMHDSKYDETASEQLADNFAARFKYGRHLIMGLDKLSSNWPERNNMVFYLFTSIDFLYSVVLRAAIIIFMIVSGAWPMAIVLTALYYIMVLSLGSRSKDMTYDELRIRYTRIRNQSIAIISKGIYNKEELKTLVASVHQMDAIIKDTKSFELIYTKLSDFFFATNASAKEDIKFQQLLEGITHNELFVKSADIATA